MVFSILLIFFFLFYGYDKDLFIFKVDKKECYIIKEVVKILFRKNEKKCNKIFFEVCRNMLFFVDVSKLKFW